MDNLFPGLKSVLSTFYDFYLLEAMEAAEIDFSSKPQEKWKEDLTTWTKDLIPDIALAIRDYLYLTSCGEARHAWEACKWAIPELNRGISRYKTYKLATQYDPTKNIHHIINIFTTTWKITGYGGKKWLKIAEAVKHYEEWPNTVFIDHAADLQHNNGTVFSKPEIDCLINFRLDISRATMQQWLYAKGKNNLLKIPIIGSEIQTHKSN